MCGIAGILDYHAPVGAPILRSMTRALQHRGPDAEGYFIRQRDSGPHVGLGHRRLSVIDLSAAATQPMTSQDGNTTIVFNGEIYNFQELRSTLTKSGAVFRSHSDTEVILQAYETWGLDFLDRLEGMFALGLWDERAQRLLLTRDRFGEKPLCYSWLPNGAFIFASEFKALHQHPEFIAEVCPEALHYYLQFEYVPAPHAIYKNAGKLPAAHYMLLENGTVTTRRYWTLSFSQNCVRSPEDVIEKTRSLLKNSVRARLVSDVPLGVFLSGGVDSSSIVSLMADCMPTNEIQSFGIGFSEGDFDETPFARLMAQHLGVSYSCRQFEASALLDLLPAMYSLMDEPFADASILPTMLLCRFARERVTVALSGDGGDELFAGYDTFLAHHPARYAAMLPLPVASILHQVLKLLPAQEKNMSLAFRLRHFLLGLTTKKIAERHQLWLGAFDPASRRALLTPELQQTLQNHNPLRLLDMLREECRCTDTLDEALHFYQRFYMNGSILAKLDSASMAASLEVRAPFLDRTLVEYVNALPPQWKLRGLTRKYLLKAVMQKQIPQSLLKRPKKGFGVPLTAWFKRELLPELTRVFEPGGITRQGFFQVKTINEMISAHTSGMIDYRKELWTLFIFQNWLEKYSTIS